MHRTLHIRFTPMPLLALLLGLLLAPALTDSASADDATPRPWRPVKALRFFVDEEADFSSIVYRQGTFYLVLPAGGEEVFLLSKRDKKVYVTDAAATDDQEPTLDPTDLGDWREIATYEKADRGRWLVWQYDKARLAVGPKPELIGTATLEQVLEEKPSYREQADAYTPDATAVAELSGSSAGLSFVVGFGTWCPVCADWTPRLIKTLEAAGFTSEQLTFVSTDPEITRPAEPLAHYAIRGVPTFIVMRDGTEVGRVEQADLDKDPDDPIESRLLRIVSGKES